MPLASIALRKGKPRAYRQAISDAVHGAMVEVMGTAPDNRFHLITEFDEDGLIYGPTFLDIPRSDDIVIIQITLRAGRSREQRVALHRRIVELLVEAPGMRPEDVYITLVENDFADWSPGRGEAPLMSFPEAGKPATAPQ